VDHFVIDKPARGGWRRELVFINNQWFTGLEFPAGYSRHTNGNMPVDCSRHYEKAGNYSFIELEGRDIEPAAKPGTIRLMHFPAFATASDSRHFTSRNHTLSRNLPRVLSEFDKF
jgi:hypothetical protein